MFSTLYVKTTYYSRPLGVLSGRELKCHQRSRLSVQAHLLSWVGIA